MKVKFMKVKSSRQRFACLWGLAIGTGAPLFYGCGDLTGEDKKDPPPVVSGGSDTTFSLENGAYYIKEVRNLNDGCGKDPLNTQRPITQLPFYLENNGQGTVAIDFCSYDGKKTEGTVRGNKGMLTASHGKRQVGSEGNRAEFDQNCRIEFKLSADNKFDGTYTEDQRNRNAVMRASTVDTLDCKTTFDFTMEKSKDNV